MDMKRIGPHTAIVATLRRQGSTSVSSLAKRIGRSPTQTMSYLQSLEEEGVVRREGDRVRLNTSR